MEAKVRIIEIFPKIQSIKSNPKDIISLSFISNENSTKIENLEQSMHKNERKIIIIKNNQYIIASGEFNLEEGINWYTLKEDKNNVMSKESLITSSTSNGNIIQNINNNPNPYLISNSPNSLETNISIENNKYFSYANSNLTKEHSIKIKLMVIFIKRKYLDKYNNFNSYLDSIIQEYLMEPIHRNVVSLNSFDHERFVEYFRKTKRNTKGKIIKGPAERKTC